MTTTKVALVLLLATLASTGIAEYDEYTVNRLESARRAALEAYEPDPFNVTSEINLHVHRALEEFENETIKNGNFTRRELGGKHYGGPCMATNPIDRCWRCNPNWANDRKALVKCVKGFGRKTTGGLLGDYYVVTDPSDNDMVNPKPGTLRFGCIQERPLWIIFAHDMVITLQQELMVTSHKTIDGRGAHVQITRGAGISLFGVTNVIVHNLQIKNIIPTNGGMIRDSVSHVGMRTLSDGDAISVFQSSNIWIDHVSLANCADGLVDVIQGSTAVTISNCHLTHHDHVMLLGASDFHVEDKMMQVTVAFNHFGQGLVQRMPRARLGFVHVVNNDYTHWIKFAIGGSAHPTIISQGNRFIAPDDINFKEITHKDYGNEAEYATWNWKSDQDLFMNGATFKQLGGPLGPLNFPKGSIIKPRQGTFASRLTRFTGALKCRVGQPC